LNIFHSAYSTDNAPIKLSYHGGNHYNSVRDTHNPSVGVGLGLPNYTPGLADKMQVDQAVQESEAQLIEDQIMEESRKASEQAQVEQLFLEQFKRESEKEAEEELLQRELDRAIIQESVTEYYASFKRTSNPNTTS